MYLVQDCLQACSLDMLSVSELAIRQYAKTNKQKKKKKKKKKKQIKNKQQQKKKKNKMQRATATIKLWYKTKKRHLSFHTSIRWSNEQLTLHTWNSNPDFKLNQCSTKPTTRLCDQRRLRSAFASAQSDQSSLIAFAFYSLRSIQRRINENPWHTGWMYRLIGVFDGYTGLIVSFVVHWLN